MMKKCPYNSTKKLKNIPVFLSKNCDKVKIYNYFNLYFFKFNSATKKDMNRKIAKFYNPLNLNKLIRFLYK
jgi:hypothetical protein